MKLRLALRRSDTWVLKPIDPGHQVDLAKADSATIVLARTPPIFHGGQTVDYRVKIDLAP